jgi:hypothetical protein
VSPLVPTLPPKPRDIVDAHDSTSSQVALAWHKAIVAAIPGASGCNGSRPMPGPPTWSSPTPTTSGSPMPPKGSNPYRTPLILSTQRAAFPVDLADHSVTVALALVGVGHRDRPAAPWPAAEARVGAARTGAARLPRRLTAGSRLSAAGVAEQRLTLGSPRSTGRDGLPALLPPRLAREDPVDGLCHVQSSRIARLGCRRVSSGSQPPWHLARRLRGILP